MIRNVGATEHEGGKKKLINLISLFQQIAEPKLFFFIFSFGIGPLFGIQ